ncbi:gap-Pol polyprotein [Clonorchis sinensis]|uniref:Gap-Pol polyprotein n=1 Tax=Clonorchis sinensis TaxID=79923 RepID=G7YML3_CLOSI|nr:gap-Pol polyprotein [Clonorchis sinensis]
MDWAASKKALAAEFDKPADRQETMRLFKTATMGHGCDPSVFFASLQQSLDLALPGLDRDWTASVSRLPLSRLGQPGSVQPALRAQLRLARATGQLSVENRVRLSRELTEAPLATLQSQEKGVDSPVEDLKNKVDQLAEQLAAFETESRRLQESLSSYPITCK